MGQELCRCPDGLGAGRGVRVECRPRWRGCLEGPLRREEEGARDAGRIGSPPGKPSRRMAYVTRSTAVECGAGAEVVCGLAEEAENLAFALSYEPIYVFIFFKKF